MATAGGEGEQHAGHRDDDRQHQQKSARRRRLQNEGGGGHHASAGSAASARSRASARSVAEPVAWNSRSSSATDRAVAAKATTMPVMTSACGTGSPPNPDAAPRRATTPKNTNTPLPSRLKATILRS